MSVKDLIQIQYSHNSRYGGRFDIVSPDFKKGYIEDHSILHLVKRGFTVEISPKQKELNND